MAVQSWKCRCNHCDVSMHLFGVAIRFPWLGSCNTLVWEHLSYGSLHTCSKCALKVSCSSPLYGRSVCETQRYFPFLVNHLTELIFGIPIQEQTSIVKPKIRQHHYLLLHRRAWTNVWSCCCCQEQIQTSTVMKRNGSCLSMLRHKWGVSSRLY